MVSLPQVIEKGPLLDEELPFETMKSSDEASRCCSACVCSQEGFATPPVRRREFDSPPVSSRPEWVAGGCRLCVGLVVAFRAWPERHQEPRFHVLLQHSLAVVEVSSINQCTC